jgi:hypothetical protein
MSLRFSGIKRGVIRCGAAAKSGILYLGKMAKRFSGFASYRYGHIGGKG